MPKRTLKEILAARTTPSSRARAQARFGNARAYATRPGLRPGEFAGKPFRRTEPGGGLQRFQPSQETNPGRVPRKPRAPSYPAVPQNLPPSRKRPRARRYF